MSNEQERMALAKRIRDTRELLGFTQDEVAKVLGLHRPAVTELEAGRRKVSSQEIVLLATFFSVTPRYLLEHDGYEPTAQISALCMGLDPEDKAQLLRFAEYLRWRIKRDQ